MSVIYHKNLKKLDTKKTAFTIIEGERTVVVCVNAYGLGKNKALSNISFHQKVFLYLVFYDNGISFPFGLLKGLNFGQKLSIFLQGNI